MSVFVALCFLYLGIGPTLAQDNNVFKITTPAFGDTVTVSKYTTDGVVVPIEWTVPDALAEKPVLISLVQGNDLASLDRISQINATGSAPNNGSYTWRGDKFDSALVTGYTHGALSGCNYSIELKVWTNVIYSDYFTIINPADGGLSSTSECPSGDAAIGPTNQTFAGTSDGQVKNDGSDQASSTGTSTGASSSSATGASSNTAAASNPGGESGGGGGGVSTTTLAVAVAVPVVVLLLAFACIIWLGIRKGWFVKKSPRDGSTVEQTGVSAQHDGEKPTGGYGDVRELHGNDRPHQLDHTSLHELQGGEGGQNYVVRN